MFTYSATAQTGRVVIHNMSVNHTETATISPSPVHEWDPIKWGDDQGIHVYGAGHTNLDGGVRNCEESKFRGPMSQVMVIDRHESQLVDPSGKPLFTNHGAVDVGEDGSRPWGVTPQIYLPAGNPFSNMGSTFIGLPENFYLNTVHNYNVNLPPIDDGTN